MKTKPVRKTPVPMSRFLSLKDSDIQRAKTLMREVCALVDLALGLAVEPATEHDDPAQLRRRLKMMAALLGEAGRFGCLGLRRLESDRELRDSRPWAV